MSLSKVDMAALVEVEGGTRLAICGDLTAEEGRTLESAAIFLVVRQGNSVVRGRGAYCAGDNEWRACVPLTESPLGVGKAVAIGLVVAETTNPVAERELPAGFSDAVGFTTSTWMQDIMIEDEIRAGRTNPCTNPCA
jgi:hypothetical protein